jgi:hypothetical protein
VDKGAHGSRADSRADCCHLGCWHLFWSASEPAVIEYLTALSLRS